MSHQSPFDENRNHPDMARTEADATSETRFGPRPVPEGHRRAHNQPDFRRTPPHGDVSPDGRRAYPRPSPLAKWLVWGGTTIAAAALTAGSVIAARHVAGMISGDGRPPKPDPYRPDNAPRPRMHLSVQPEPDHGPEARGPRPQRQPRRSLMEEIETNTASLTNNVDNVVRSVTAAVEGFHSVATQAHSIMREFGDAAELVRDIINRPHAPPQGETRRPFHAAPKDPTAETAYHATRDEGEYVGPADHDPRTHRL
ncbi:hypothetical protein [Paracoccus aestuariivivens]|uniref:Uncharacterized protein n=1 Tax=Paracoccus aestuariivivens TaxID=1820333 RepID=A0A6L6JE70_9RHOB|nr:hypothetical protein [Paracoccus aestuariivivens]MTH79488.1 hypothetical protein [Paracoccus aestuariivivens]